jgi:hypothetical protein
LISGTGISISTVNGAATITNSITNTNQLTNGAGYITGITSSMVTSALGYTPYNAAGNTVLTNVNYTSYALRWNSTQAPANGLDNTSIVPNSVTLFDGYGAPIPGYPAGDAQWWVGALTIGDASRGFQIAGGYADNNMYFRKGNSAWSAWRRVWTDANLTNLNQLTNGPGYITGYTETDTLASVTARGASTSTTLNLDGRVNIGNSLTRPSALNSDSVAHARIGGADVHLYVASLGPGGGYKVAVQAARISDFASFDLDLQSNGGILRYGGNEIATRTWVQSQSYITGYTETDTLASVTGRGASTSTALSLNGGVTITGPNTWNATTPMLNIGGSGDGRLQVRHIWGKDSATSGTDSLWLQYGSPSSHVQIGGGGNNSNLYVQGDIYMNGYFAGNLVATRTWVTSQSYLTGITSSQVTTALGYTPWNFGSIDAARNIVSGTNLDTDLENGGAYSSYGAGGTSWNAPFSYGGVIGFAFTSGIRAQFGFDIRHTASDYGDLWYRTKNNVGYSTWRTMLHSANYSSYALPLTGGTLSGPLTINTTGDIVANSETFRMKGGGGSGEFIWYRNYSGSPSHPGFVIINRTGTTTFSHNSNGGGTSVSGNFSAANFSGSSSGTNTGDQTNISGNAGTVSSITGNTGLMVNRLTPTSFIDGLTTNNFRTTLFGTSANGAAISAARWNNVPTALSGMTMYGTMIAWSGDSDTHGFVSTNYETPGVTVGGGYGNFISWSKRLAFSDGTGASGTWNINTTGTLSNGNFYINGNGYGITNADEWPHIYWLRNTGAGWDEGLIKGSSSRGFFGRAGWGIHMDQSRAFHFFSSGWESLFGVEGGTGNTRIKGTLTIGGNTIIGANGTSTSYGAASLGKLYFGTSGSDSPDYYNIATNMENFGGNYTKLDFAWYTGQRFYAHNGYGGFRFKEITGGQATLFSIGEGDLNVRVGNNLYIGSAGGWITDLLNAKQNASSAITTSNIGSQTVSGLNCQFQGNGTVNVGWGYSAVLRNETGSQGNIQYAPIFHVAASDTMWQITGDYFNSSTLRWRAGYSGSWYSWREILHSANFNSYSPTLTGGGASGTWSINVTGSAGSLSNMNISQFTNNSGYITSSGSASSAGTITGRQRGSFTVGGNTSTFYPVAFQIGSGATGEQGISVLQIERGGYDEPGYSNYTFSTFHARIRAKADGWGYGASYVQVEANAYTVPMMAEVTQQNQTSQLIVWLRGGCSYRWMDIEGGWGLNFSNPSGGNYVTHSGNVTYTPTTTNTIGSNFKYQQGWGNNYISGNFTAGGDVVAFSDARVKNNLRPIENVIDRICKSRGILYDRTDVDSKNNIGFIAQELEETFPELVTTDGDRKSVKYQNATAILFEAIKEQQKQIEYLKSELNGLTK